MARIIISGGMGGIGRATAELLARLGHRVGIVYYHSQPQDVDAFLSTLAGTGHAARAADLSDETSTSTAVEKLANDLGGIDVCIHAAVSPLVRKPIMRISFDEFKQQFKVSTFGGLNVFHAVVPHLQRSGGGTIIGLTSEALEAPAPSGMSGYTCAKSALRGILRELSGELVQHGIGVCAVSPGFVPTELHNDLDPRVFAFLKASKNTMTVEEVAQAIARVCEKTPQEIRGLSFPVRGEPRPL